MPLTPLVRPSTCTGTGESVVESLPSWPAELSPQHFTPPLTIAQVRAPGRDGSGDAREPIDLYV